MSTDADLLRRSITDAAAFRELYERHATAIHGFHLRRSRDEDAAHDLTAETFAQAWLVRARFVDRAGGSAAPWLFGIARNVMLEAIRRRSLEQAACERLGLLADREAAGMAEPSSAWLDGLDEAVAELPPGQQDALRLRFDEDLAYDEVADALDTTPQAARVRVHRALRSLRDRFTDATETTR